MNIDVTSVTDILRELQSRKFGRYKGIVVDDKDETGRGRLRVQVKDILGEEPVWMPGVFPVGGNSTQAFVFVPPPKSTVLVEFIGGDVSFPVWTGTYWDADDNPDPPEPVEVATDSRLSLIRTRLGVEIRVLEKGEGDDAEVSLVIKTPDEARFAIDQDGKVEVLDRDGVGLTIESDVVTLNGHSGAEVKLTGSKVELKGGDASITMDGGTVTIAARAIKLDATQEVGLGQGANAPLLNAQTFVTQFGAHAHPTPAGPAGPPTPPTLVDAVKLLKVKGI